MKSVSSSLIFPLSLLALPSHVDELMETARELFAAVPTEPSLLEGNQPTSANVAIGKKPLFEPRLSQSRNSTCSTCHDPGQSGGTRLIRGGERPTLSASARA